MTMRSNGKKVVVLVSEELRTHESGKCALRFRSLGLTAYGRTEDETRVALHKMFRLFVNDLRRRGILEDRLGRLGVKWYPGDEYPGNWDNVIDVTPTETSRQHPGATKQRTWSPSPLEEMGLAA